MDFKQTKRTDQELEALWSEGSTDASKLAITSALNQLGEVDAPVALKSSLLQLHERKNNRWSFLSFQILVPSCALAAFCLFVMFGHGGVKAPQSIGEFITVPATENDDDQVALNFLEDFTNNGTPDILDDDLKTLEEVI